MMFKVKIAEIHAFVLVIREKISIEDAADKLKYLNNKICMP